MADYNGWKNRDTWNVALWVGNDEGLYRSAVKYLRLHHQPSWLGFVSWSGLDQGQTPDGVAWASDDLDLDALDEMLEELLS